MHSLIEEILRLKDSSTWRIHVQGHEKLALAGRTVFWAENLKVNPQSWISLQRWTLESCFTEREKKKKTQKTVCSFNYGLSVAAERVASSWNRKWESLGWAGGEKSFSCWGFSCRLEAFLSGSSCLSLSHVNVHSCCTEGSTWGTRCLL